MFSLPAVLTGVIAYSRIDDHGVADLDASGRIAAEIADGIYYPRRIGTQDPGRYDLQVGKPAQHEEVEVVQSDRFDADAYLAALRLGLRQIGAVLELIEAAVRRDGSCS